MEPNESIFRGDLWAIRSEGLASNQEFKNSRIQEWCDPEFGARSLVLLEFLRLEFLVSFCLDLIWAKGSSSFRYGICWWWGRVEQDRILPPDIVRNIHGLEVLKR